MADGPEQDVFISYASADKERYVYPLTEALAQREVTFWLDEAQIGWGDSVSGKINEGLRGSRYALVCLSKSFLKRPWPETEMSALMSLQNSDGMKRVLPLILNSKDEVLAQYPLIGDLAYREFGDSDRVAAEIAEMAGSGSDESEQFVVTVESVHTGTLCRLKPPPRASVKWLAKMAQSGLDLKEAVEVGPFSELRIRWVLVDAAAEEEWREMPRHRQRLVHALVAGEEGPRVAQSSRDRIGELGVRSGTVFHLYAVEDEDFGLPAAGGPMVPT